MQCRGVHENQLECEDQSENENQSEDGSNEDTADTVAPSVDAGEDKGLGTTPLSMTTGDPSPATAAVFEGRRVLVEMRPSQTYRGARATLPGYRGTQLFR